MLFCAVVRKVAALFAPEETEKIAQQYAAWSFEMLQQLDIAHVAQFPALLTYRYLTISHRA